MWAACTTVDPRKLEHGLRRISARIPYTLPKGMRIMMFQLSGFYYTSMNVAIATSKFWDFLVGSGAAGHDGQRRGAPRYFGHHLQTFGLRVLCKS